jgi:beta-hydroxylase
MVWQTFFSLKFIILYVYVASVAYTQFRGKVRLNFSKQVFNHGTLLAPINALMYLFSAVPNQPFFELKQFSALTKLQDNWETIRAEAQTLVEQGYIKISTNNDDAGFNSFFKKGWKRFYLKWYSDCLPSAQNLCPKTIELLQAIPEIKGAMFTLLPKGGRLNPHRDPYAGSLRYHLGLITPNSEKCRIYVDGIPYAWQDGEAVVFDETYIHSAKNETDIDRIILFCDIERPLRNKVVTVINRWVSKYLVAESATQNLPTDPIGMINKLFKYYHAIAAQGDRLKKFNKPIYHFVKYGTIALLLYLIFF